MAITQVGTELIEFLGTVGSPGTSSAIDTTGVTLLIVHTIYFSGSGGATLLSDSKSNTFQDLTARENAVGNITRYCFSPTVGSGHTFTITRANAADIFPTVYVYGFSGAVAFYAESGATRLGIPGTSLQPGSLTPPTNGALIFTGCGAAGSDLIGVDSGLTFASVNNDDQGIGWKVQSTAAAINPTWSWTNNSEGSATMAVFLETTPGGGGGTANSLFLICP